MTAWTVVVLACVALPGESACRRHLIGPRGDAAAVVIVAPDAQRASKPVFAITEREPNNSAEEAQFLEINPQWPIVSVEGTLAATGKDVDVFKIVVPPLAPGTEVARSSSDSGAADDPRRLARRLSVEVASKGVLGLTGQLLDEEFRLLEGMTVDPGAAAGMPNLAVLPGHTYFLRVMVQGKRTKMPEPAPADCAYKLTAELGDFELGEEREPNDGVDTATPVTMAGTAEMAGYHGWSRDQDFYRVVAAEGPASLDVSVDAVEGVSAGLQVTTVGGARLAAGKGRRGEGIALRNVNISGEAGASGPVVFFVAVRGESGQNRDQRYVLHLSLGATKVDAEIEPNDSQANATVVRDGTVNGYLPAGDVDFFRYLPDGDREVDITVVWPARIRGKIEVFRSENAGTLPTGQPPAGGALASAESKKPRQVLSLPKVQAPAAGLLIRLSPLKGDGNANEPYALRFASGSPAIP